MLAPRSWDVLRVVLVSVHVQQATGTAASTDTVLSCCWLVCVCLQNTPWAQSQAYQAALVQDTTRNPASLTLVGRGDPTGRGHGFSFIRDDPKKAKEEAAPPSGLQAQADGTITGAG